MNMRLVPLFLLYIYILTKFVLLSVSFKDPSKFKVTVQKCVSFTELHLAAWLVFL